MNIAPTYTLNFDRSWLCIDGILIDDMVLIYLADIHDMSSCSPFHHSIEVNYQVSLHNIVAHYLIIPNVIVEQCR
jgi:hypothetical protein